VKLMTASVAGISSAAPRPMIARAAISSPVLCEYAAKTEARPNSAMPLSRVLRWPKRSPRAPPVKVTVASTSV